MCRNDSTAVQPGPEGWNAREAVSRPRRAARVPPALACREQAAALADEGVVALRQARDELVRVRRLRGRLDLLVRRLRAAVGDVAADALVEEQRILENDAELPAQGLLLQVAQVHA